MSKRKIFVVSLILLVLASIIFLARDSIRSWMFSVSGEESLPGQVRGSIDYLANFTRAQPDTANSISTTFSESNVFGVNTFLEQEVEPIKRDQQLQMIQDAGIGWIRQQFPWADIEISGKNNFDDCRNANGGACISAWAKYDNIVDLAQKHNINIVARLDAPPKWAQSIGGDFAPPQNLADYTDYVAAVVNRYKGKVKFYQIWNEPNNYPEWGEQPVNAEAFTQLLCAAYQRIKSIDPQAAVIAPALTPTISLDPGPGPGTGLNEFIFLQRMYDAGAGQCFDIMSAQGYGLFTAPTDRRTRPRIVNFSRPMYIRDIMVKNGDANKSIWISEMNWNSVPDSIPDKRFGQVTIDQQARYLPLAYQRIRSDYPWVGVAFTWYFKPASDAEKDQPKYYFRLVNPDFTPLPVYESLKEYATK